MEEAKRKLDDAFAIMARIKVSGDDVDLMAAARQRLREAYQAMKEEAESRDSV